MSSEYYNLVTKAVKIILKHAGQLEISFFFIIKALRRNSCRGEELFLKGKEKMSKF